MCIFIYIIINTYIYIYLYFTLFKQLYIGVNVCVQSHSYNIKYIIINHIIYAVFIFYDLYFRRLLHLHISIISHTHIHSHTHTHTHTHTYIYIIKQLR